MGVTIEEFVAELGWEIDNKALRQFDKGINNLKQNLKTLAKVGTLAAAGLTFGITKVMKAFSQIEDATAAFQPMLGSVEKARKLVDRLNETAATTPYQFQTLSKAAKQLLPNMSGDIEKTIATVRMLGDTAGGQATKMDSIVRGYNKALLKGKVDMESLNIIAEAGVPIMNELAKVTNTPMGEKFFKNIEKRKVTVEHIEQALKNMTSEGGMFFKGMEIASLTLSGRISTLKDNIMLAEAEIGDALSPSIKGVIEDILSGVQAARKWIEANKDLIRSGFKEWFDKLVETLRSIVGYLQRVNAFVQRIGGWSKTISRLGLAFAMWRLGPILLGLSGILKTLTLIKALNIGRALGLLALRNLAAGGLLLLIPLLIEDIYTTLKGGKGAFYEWGVWLSDAMMQANEWAASMAGISLDEFNLAMVQTMNDVKKAWADADAAIADFFSNILEGIYQAIISVENFGSLLYSKIRGFLSNIWGMISNFNRNGGAPRGTVTGGFTTLPQPSRSYTSSVKNDNRSYSVSPSATINQGTVDMRRAQRQITKAMENQMTEALGSVG